VKFVKPEDGAEVGARIDIEVEARDPGPVTKGIREVRIDAKEQGGTRAVPIATLPGPGPTFRTSLASGAIHPGSLRVVAGEAVAVGPETVHFRLQGRPGERAVFSFDME
jgi:hypothetical protein